MIRKSLLLATIVVLFALNSIVAFAATPVLLDGQPVNVTPVIVDGRTLMPARDVVELLGGDVEWDGALRQVTILHESTIVLLIIDNATAYVNGNATTLDVPPQIIDDSTKIPLRFVAEALGVDVDFVDGTITISTEFAAETVPVIAQELTPAGYTPQAEYAPAVDIEYNDWLNSSMDRAVWTANRTSPIVHRTSDCSNMGSPVEWTRQTALDRNVSNIRPCQNCWTNRGD